MKMYGVPKCEDCTAPAVMWSSASEQGHCETHLTDEERRARNLMNQPPWMVQQVLPDLGITREQYDQLVLAQRGECPFCGTGKQPAYGSAAWAAQLAAAAPSGLPIHGAECPVTKRLLGGANYE